MEVGGEGVMGVIGPKPELREDHDERREEADALLDRLSLLMELPPRYLVSGEREHGSAIFDSQGGLQGGIFGGPPTWQSH